jgi:enterochelin esterase family protein
MKRWGTQRAYLGALLAMVIVTQVNAQARRGEPSPGDRIESTEVQPDGRVVFRIFAPKADEVTLSGDWIPQGLGTGGRLEKDEQGVWSIAVGPLPADLYSYTFNVDGVKTADPRNPLIKQGIRGIDNMFWLPGDAAAFEDNQQVPHGEIRQVWYASQTLGMQRRMHVYTPPGYDLAQRYPVLYLLHGGGDEDSGWSTIGRAGLILDNLLAAGKARPMLIVMPNGSLPPPTPRSESESATTGDLGARRAESQNRFTDELIHDIVPTVEKSFSVRAEPIGRAIAGLSMGGGQTLRVLVGHFDQFAYAAIWSAGVRNDTAEWEQQNEQFLKAADRVNQSMRRIEIVVGDQDFALNGSKSLAELFTRHGIRHELQITPGGHTWINWRRYLHELAPKLFEPSSGT